MRDAHRAEERRLLLLTAAAGLGAFDSFIVRP